MPPPNPSASARSQLLLSPTTTVRCPACEQEFSLEQGFARKALEHLEQDSRGALAQRESEVRQEAERRASGAAEAQQETARRQIEQLEQRIQSFGERQAALDQQLQAAREQELVLRRAKSALEDRAGQLELEVARRLDAGRSELEARIRAQEKERGELEKLELQKKLDDVNAKLVEAQQKSSQGSQQLQGEVFELALEEQLRLHFAVDSFEEVRKGARGADIIQRVTTRSLQVAGTILWEAKRAREWGRDWPAKLKQDMRAAGADLGILVTTTLPPALPAAHVFGLHEDIWVTSWSAAIPLAQALRGQILELHKQRAVSAGKGEKMEALYDYLTSAQFAHKLRAVYGTFKAMQDDLQKERSAAEQRLARREKQIATGMKELLGFAGDVQGLSQQSLPQLEMEPGEGEGGGTSVRPPPIDR